MRNAANKLVAVFSMCCLLLGGGLLSQMAEAAARESTAEGKKFAFDIKKGNCLACHMIPGGVSPGNIGPPLVAMRARFPDRQKLRAQIYDASLLNPGTRMPPFGKYKVLSDKEIDAIVDYLYTL